MNLLPIRSSARPAAAHGSEDGYVLLTVIFFLALLVLSLAVAAPRVARSIQRDRELETFHRGMQYRRAIQLYYRKFHAYPPNADALVKTQDIRFLRKKYIDPVTGVSDWKPIMFGQNKVPTAMGFFGQPLSGGATTLAGIGPSGGSGLAGTPSSGSAFGGGGSFSSGSSFGPSPVGAGQTPSFGSPGSTPGSPGSSPSGTGSTGTSGTDQNGQTFGGAGIIGFSPASSKQSILVYKKKNHYSEWEFTYDPLSDMKTMGAGNTGTIGQPMGNSPNPLSPTPTPTPNPSPTTNTPQ